MVRTLVVDDDVDVLELVAALLERAGHEVTTSANGLEAFDLLLAEDFDLCVLDHELPGLTGLEIASAFRESGKDTRLLLVSGLTRLTLEGVEPSTASCASRSTPTTFSRSSRSFSRRD